MAWPHHVSLHGLLSSHCLPVTCLLRGFQVWQLLVGSSRRSNCHFGIRRKSRESREGRSSTDVDDFDLCLVWAKKQGWCGPERKDRTTKSEKLTITVSRCLHTTEEKKTRQLQTACGCWLWRLRALKEFITNIVLLKKLSFAFQHVWFSTIYNYLHLLCKTDEAATEFLSTFFTFDLNFGNFKDWITFRTESRWFSIEICAILLLTAWTVYNKSYCNKMN